MIHSDHPQTSRMVTVSLQEREAFIDNGQSVFVKVGVEPSITELPDGDQGAVDLGEHVRSSGVVRQVRQVKHACGCRGGNGAIGQGDRDAWVRT